MKFLKKHKGNIIFLALLAIIFFTPIGFQLKVLVNRYINFAPSEITKEEQIKLSNYNWNLTDAKGNDIDFNKYKDKVILINFWATWCPPCVAEMPSFQELYDSYKNEVVFLFVANDKAEKVTSFMKKENYTFPVQFESSATPPELVSSSLPTTFILDKKGNIVMQKKGAANWNSDKVRNLLDRLLKE
ncbi:MAG: TlpA disulfide reductase family protein [Flavobacteriales bacterium]